MEGKIDIGEIVVWIGIISFGVFVLFVFPKLWEQTVEVVGNAF